MKQTTDRNDAQMTLAVIAAEYDVPYNTINTTSELLDYFDVPPDIYVTHVIGKDPAIELIWEMQTRNYLQISIRECSLAIVDGMVDNKGLNKYQYHQTMQDCINIYKKYYKRLKEQFSIYEESF